MNINELKPANQLAKRFGVKALAYGGPGVGKTPLVNSAPRPVMCVVEPGMLSMRDSNVPAWEAYDVPRILEFFKWLFTSKEALNFDTVAVDSVSQMAEIFLTDELKKHKDGRKAYGEMSRQVMEIVNGLYYLPQKHVYLIGKQTVSEESGTNRKKPYFPGQELNVKIPHMYDEILHIGQVILPGTNRPVVGIRTAECYDIMARDRSGRLAEIEEPNLTKLFNKAMS